MSKQKGQYIGASPGIHSIQEKDDIFEADIDAHGQNNGSNKKDYNSIMNTFGKYKTHFIITGLYQIKIQQFL